MKKIITGMLLILAVGMQLFAAGTRDTPVMIEGKLAVNKTVPSIVSEDKTWLLPSGPFYQIAWENGIKVGDTIKAEGHVLENRSGPGTAEGVLFIPTKVWVNGKLIDISTVRADRMPGRFMRPGMGPRPDNGPVSDDAGGPSPDGKSGIPDNNP